MSKTAHDMQWNIGDRQLRDINGIVNTKTEGKIDNCACLPHPSSTHGMFLLEAVNCADRDFIFQKGMSFGKIF